MTHYDLITFPIIFLLEMSRLLQWDTYYRPYSILRGPPIF